MFPNNIIEKSNTENTSENIGCDFLFDYDTGQHITKNAVLAECTVIQGVQQFIQNVRRTKINSYKVYTEGETETFGISIYDYLGQRTLPLGYLNSELKREVTEQLLKHPIIVSVTDWKGTREKRGLHISFNVTLTDGTEIKESDFYVQGNAV